VAPVSVAVGARLAIVKNATFGVGGGVHRWGRCVGYVLGCG
jgi:hypothetical protein